MMKVYKVEDRSYVDWGTYAARHTKYFQSKTAALEYRAYLEKEYLYLDVYMEAVEVELDRTKEK